MRTFICGYCVTDMPEKCMKTLHSYGRIYICTGKKNKEKSK